MNSADRDPIAPGSDAATAGGAMSPIVSSLKTPRHPLGPQLWVSKSGLPPSRELLCPVKNGLFRVASKPRWGGLWTSTYDATTGESAWLHFWRHQAAAGEEPPLQLDHPRFVLYPAPDAKVLVIRTLGDLIALRARYRRTAIAGDPLWLKDTGLDFERIAQEYDALHLSLEASLEIEDPGALYGWEIESTLWFRWAFEDAVIQFTR